MSTAHAPYPDPSCVPSLDAGHWFATQRGVNGLPVPSDDARSGGIFISDSPTTGQRIVLHDLLLSVEGDATVTIFEETTGTVIHGPLYLAARTTLQLTLRGKTKLPTADKRLKLVTAEEVNLSAEAIYHSEP